jgi:hypothetical protein
LQNEVRRSSGGLPLTDIHEDIAVLDEFAVLGREVLVHEDRLQCLPLVHRRLMENQLQGACQKRLIDKILIFISILGVFFLRPDFSRNRPVKFGGQNVYIVYILSLARALL